MDDREDGTELSARGNAGVAGDSARPAVEDLHEFLSSRPQLAADSQEMLSRLSEERLLTFGGKPFSRYLRPHIITPAQHAAITGVVRTLASAFVKLRRAMMHDRSLV